MEEWSGFTPSPPVSPVPMKSLLRRALDLTWERELRHAATKAGCNDVETETLMKTIRSDDSWRQVRCALEDNGCFSEGGILNVRSEWHIHHELSPDRTQCSSSVEFKPWLFRQVPGTQDIQPTERRSVNVRLKSETGLSPRQPLDPRRSLQVRVLSGASDLRTQMQVTRLNSSIDNKGGVMRTQDGKKKPLHAPTPLSRLIEQWNTPSGIMTWKGETAKEESNVEAGKNSFDNSQRPQEELVSRADDFLSNLGSELSSATRTTLPMTTGGGPSTRGANTGADGRQRLLSHDLIDLRTGFLHEWKVTYPKGLGASSDADKGISDHGANSVWPIVQQAFAEAPLFDQGQYVDASCSIWKIHHLLSKEKDFCLSGVQFTPALCDHNGRRSQGDVICSLRKWPTGVRVSSAPAVDNSHGEEIPATDSGL